MISWKTILSVFDDKMTLLQWLQAVEKSLQNDTVTSITIEQSAPNTVVMVLNLADGSNVTSDPITIPAGKDGKDGSTITGITTQGSRVVNGNTETEIEVALSDKSMPITFTVSAKNGTDGKDGIPGATGPAGNGIVSIHTLSHSVVGNETITNIEVAYDEGALQTFEVHAQNGEGGGGGVTEEEFNTFKQSTETSIGDINKDIEDINTKLGETNAVTDVRLTGAVNNNNLVLNVKTEYADGSDATRPTTIALPQNPPHYALINISEMDDLGREINITAILPNYPYSTLSITDIRLYFASMGLGNTGVACSGYAKTDSTFANIYRLRYAAPSLLADIAESEFPSTTLSSNPTITGTII